jgi:hypothetical protein
MREQGIECPACGGAGGGPFGLAGSAWDVEGYVCSRCEGAGVLREGAPVPRPLAKGRAAAVSAESAKTGSHGR